MSYINTLLSKPAEIVAPQLLGMYLVCTHGNEKIKAKIIETEAYCGEKDLANHSSKGRTKRTEVMYKTPGTIYVYLCYGIHNLFNIVTNTEDVPDAVLIRGIEIDGVKIIGPGRITKALGITMKDNNTVLNTKRIALQKGESHSKIEYDTAPRIGVEYAGPEWSKKPLRFILK